MKARIVYEVEALPWMILQDRHCQMAFGYAKSEEEAKQYASEWNRTHGKCGDHFHEAWVQPTIEVWQQHPSMFDTELTLQDVLDGRYTTPKRIELVEE